MDTIRVQTSQHIDIDYPVAGLGERIAARLIDLAIQGSVFLAAFALSLRAASMIPVLIFSIVIYTFYYLLAETLMNGQSIGKKLMKIRVISLDGRQATFGQHFIRWLFRLVDFGLTAQLGGLLSIALSGKKQRIGDIVAGTVVVFTVPRANFNDIAFQVADTAYTPVFPQTVKLQDSDIALISEVIGTFYKTRHSGLVYTTAAKLYPLLGVSLPEGMNELQFLETVVRDYTYLTSIPV